MFYLAATLSSGLVAVFMESFLHIAVTGSAHGRAPPSLGTRLLHSVRTDKDIGLSGIQSIPFKMMMTE